MSELELYGYLMLMTYTTFTTSSWAVGCLGELISNMSAILLTLTATVALRLSLIFRSQIASLCCVCTIRLGFAGRCALLGHSM